MATRDLYALVLVEVPTGPADVVLDLPADIDVLDVAEALDVVYGSRACLT